MRIGIVGMGEIGSALSTEAQAAGWHTLMANTSGVFAMYERQIDTIQNIYGRFEDRDVVCICISTRDDGFAEFQLMRHFLERGMPVATCAKGALANYFWLLKEYLVSIGYSATVGGGIRPHAWLKDRITRHTREIHCIINGTLTYILNGIHHRRTLEAMAYEAGLLGYAEPGADNPLAVINQEACRDVPMKVAVLVNACGLGEIRASDINVNPINSSELRRLEQEAYFRRHIVSITQRKEDGDVIGGFTVKVGDWYVSGGFRDSRTNPLFRQLTPHGVNNVVLIHGKEGTYVLDGPGAGANATVGSLMYDIKRLYMEKLHCAERLL